jgi:hypothetical protein
MKDVLVFILISMIAFFSAVSIEASEKLVVPSDIIKIVKPDPRLEEAAWFGANNGVWRGTSVAVTGTITEITLVFEEISSGQARVFYRRGVDKNHITGKFSRTADGKQTLEIPAEKPHFRLTLDGNRIFGTYYRIGLPGSESVNLK